LLTEHDLRHGLQTKRFGRKVYTFETIDSTNTCARALAGCWAAEGTVVFAEEQTAGKGRLGRSWTSAPGDNLTFTIVLRPSLPPTSLNLLPLLTGVAVSQAIERFCGVKTECKWPNDLLIGGRKVAGILLESSFKQEMVEYVVIGVGLNVNQTEFPAEIEHRATSLRLITGAPIDRPGLFREIMSSLEDRYDRLAIEGYDSIVPEWLLRSPMVGRQIEVSQDGAVFTGVVRGIGAEGALLLETAGQVKGLVAGDVTILDHANAARD
jgi:BirA family biotin operon repressor/biotin-[acetyl-CoA-carboxylase] ligase